MMKSPFRVLVVDDNLRLRTELIAALGEEGIDVAGEADDGEAGVVLAQSVPVDVVLMDLRMTGINGIEATRQIALQVDPPEIVLLSAYDDPALRSAATDVGAFDYVIKGCRIEFLAGVICQAARKVRSRRQVGMTCA